MNKIFTLAHDLLPTKENRSMSISIGLDTYYIENLMFEVYRVNDVSELIALTELLKKSKIPYNGIFDGDSLIAVALEQIDDEILKINKIYDAKHKLILPST